MNKPPAWPDYSRANTVHTMLVQLEPQELRELFAQIDRESLERGILYEHDGKAQPVPVLIRPRLLASEQVAYFTEVADEMNDAFDRLVRLYRQTPALRQLFPFTAAEQTWIDRYLPAAGSTGALIIRWDANARFAGRHWRGEFSLFEANAVGIGGLHYGPSVDELLCEVILPRLQKVDPQLRLEPAGDARAMLRDQLAAHAAEKRIAQPSIALVIDCRSIGGPVEFAKLAEYLTRSGLPAVMVDARDLRVRQGAVYAGEREVNLAYRDTALSELTEYQAAGEDLTGIEQLFDRGCVLSSIAGELDHKAALEVFTDSAWEDAFTPAQRRIFKRHALWTRVLFERRTTDASGDDVDLLPHVRAAQRQYVIKPNRAFGGAGVILGRLVSAAQWSKAVDQAEAHPGEFVVQQRAVVSRKKFPILKPDGTVGEAGLHVVCGFYAYGGQLAMIGRASGAAVVNIAQRGGMTGLLVCPNRTAITEA